MTAEELAARVREDVDRNGDLIRKRDDARREIDHPRLGRGTWKKVAEDDIDVECNAFTPGLREERKIANTPTESILGKAHRLVQGRRGAEYGHPLDNHGATAEMFAAYLQRKYDVRVPLDAEDVCLMNVLQKVSREANEHHDDNLVDIAGYVFNVELLRGERDRREGAK